MLDGFGDPCMSQLARERHLERVGRPCIRAEPILATEEAVLTAHELMSHVAAAAGLGTWIWERRTAGMPEALKVTFFRWVNVYMSEYRRHEAAHSKAKAKQKAAGGTVAKTPRRRR